MSARAREVAAPALLFVALIGLWEVAAQTGVLANILLTEQGAGAGGDAEFLVPAPSDIADALWNDRDLLAEDAWVTLREVVLGFALALISGLALAVLIHLSKSARRAVYPLLVASQTIPIVVLAPILVVWFGFGIFPKLLIIALICFFPITVNAYDGLRSVDPDLLKMMRTLGAGRGQTLRRAELPWALPFIFSGAKIAVAVAVIGAVFAEWAGADSGLGHLILVSSGELSTSLTFAAIVVLSAIAICLFALLALVERRVVTWKEGSAP
ncbi:MAG TPA: ABC transporter permease [Solirubrobacterales bacterium]|nr:ABC transporter permease [Solirubrobacterales bacterium]